jgi:hypothetical protein
MNARTERVAAGRCDPGSAPAPAGSEVHRRVAFVVAVVFTCASLLQQLLYALDVVRGWPIPVLRGSPIPLLLVAAPAWVLARPWPPPPPRLRRAAAVISRVPVSPIVAFAFLLTVVLWHGLQGAEPYLGHDEAVYATKARSWLTSFPAAQWRSYRPLGLPALGWIALGIRDSVGAVRVLGLVLVLGTLAVTYFVAARLTTARRAAVAVLVIVSGWGFLRRLPEFLDDIAAAGLLLAVAYLIVRSRQRSGSGALLAASALAVAAFYIRYGALAGLFAIGIAAVVTWGPRGWVTSWRDIAAAGIFLAGLAANLVYSSLAAGSPLAILLQAGQIAQRAYIGDGLVYYALVFPFRLAGDLGGVVMAAGLAAAFLAARRLRQGADRTGDRVRVFFALAAVIQVIVLGLTAHGEERFVFLSVLMLVILGVDAIAGFAGRWSTAALAVVAAFAALAAVVNYDVVVNGDVAAVTAQRTSLVAVAQRLSSRHPCLVVTGFQPELGWYSGCATTSFGQAELSGLPTGQRVYVVLFRGAPGQPGTAALRRIVAGRQAVTTTMHTRGSLGRARIITLEPGR